MAHMVPHVIDLAPFVRAGDNILIGQGTGEPRALVEALIAQRHQLGGVTVFLGSSYTGLFQPEHGDAITFTSYGAIGTVSTLAQAGVLHVIPAHFGSIAQLIDSGRLLVDVAMVQVSPAAADGTHSLGLVADYTRRAIAKARVTLAEVNPRVPFTSGDTIVTASDLAAVVTDDRPLIEVPRRTPTATDVAIANHIATLIPDGATLQLGVGSTPDAVLASLRGATDLGFHSGLISEAVVDLIEAGVITNARKEIDSGVTVGGLLFGGDRLFRWGHNNAALSMRDVAYTHDAAVLSSFKSFFGINSAIEVDLTGQINGEVAGGRYIGAVGGAGAFARAGIMCSAGRSIVALGATAASGAISRIVPLLDDRVVSTARADADIIVTEHGIADLRGQTLQERARRMIAIADPRHRDDLARAGR
jgi:acyl-CoA hydrolase